MRPCSMLLYALMLLPLTGLGTAADIPQATARHLEERAEAFWKAFCREDIAALTPIVDEDVLSDIRKALWMRRHWAAIHHQVEDHAAATAVVPRLTFTTITPTSLLDVHVAITEVPAYRLAFTCAEMSGTICVTQDATCTVIGFNDH